MADEPRHGRGFPHPMNRHPLFPAYLRRKLRTLRERRMPELEYQEELEDELELSCEAKRSTPLAGDGARMLRRHGGDA
jgi:hypothetical protein